METTGLIVDSEANYLAKNLVWWAIFMTVVGLLLGGIGFLIVCLLKKDKKEIIITPMTSESPPEVPKYLKSELNLSSSSDTSSGSASASDERK